MQHITLPAVLFLCLACAGGDANAHNSCRKLECEKTRARIAKIESKMRRGYSASAGEKMQEQLRQLRRRRSKVCR